MTDYVSAGKGLVGSAHPHARPGGAARAPGQPQPIWLRPFRVFQGSDADKSEDNLVVDEVSAQGAGSVGAACPPARGEGTGTLQAKGGTRGSGGIPWVQAPSRQLAAGVWLGPSPLCSSPPPLPRTLRPRTASTPTRPVRTGWKSCHWGGRRLCRSARPPWPPRAARPRPAARMCPRYVRALLPLGLASPLP